MTAWRRPTGVWRAARGRGAEVSIIVWIGLVAFIGLGLPEATLGVTWPSIRAELDRPLSAIGLLLGAITFGYLPASALSGRIVARVGAGPMLAAASATFATAMGLYLVGQNLGVLVAGSLLSGVAAGIIDPGINTQFALRYGTRAMNLLHASFGVGATSGPFIATMVIGAGGSWRVPYALYAVVHGGLLVAFIATRDRWADGEGDVQEVQPPAAAVGQPAVAGVPESDHASVTRRHESSEHTWVVVASVLTFFVYTGLEVGAGVLAFTLLTESRGMADTTAGLWVTGYWAGLTLGRAALGVLGSRVGPETVVRVATASAVGATLFIASDPGGAGALGLPLLGMVLAGIFPSLVLLTPRRVGSTRTPGVMGLQFSIAAIGASGLPAAITLIAESHLERIGWALAALAGTVTLLDLLLRRASSAAPTPVR